MKQKIDQITRKKLVIIKQLYQSAVKHASSRYSPASRIMAVIGFDLAVETALKTVVAALDASKQPGNDFMAVLNQADSKLNNENLPSIPDRAHILYVHGLRNDAQHKAKYPTDEDVTECKIYVRDFLDQLISNLWGIRLDNISLADLVQNDQAKTFLQNAEQAMEKEDYVESVKQSNTALTWIIWRVKNTLFGNSVNLTEDLDITLDELIGNDEMAEAIKNAYEPIRDEISSELNEIRDMLTAIALGLDYAGFVRLNRMDFDVAAFDSDGRASYQPFLFDKSVDKSDALFAFNYCVEAIIQIESQVGNIEPSIGPNVALF